MKITQRLIVLFSIVSLSLGVFIYLFFLIKHEEGRLYSQADALQRRQIITAFFDIRKSEMMRLVEDLSGRPALLSYTGNRSRSWADQNLHVLIDNHNLDLVQIYDTSGVPFYSAESGLWPQISGFRLPPAFLHQLQTRHQEYFTDPWLEEYIQVSTAAIYDPADSTASQPARGYLVIGKLWNRDYISSVSRALDYNIRFFDTEPTPVSPAAIFNVNLTIPLQGSNGKPVAWLRFSGDNPFIRQWQSLGKEFLVGILIFTLIFLILQFALLLIWIRAPLKLISTSLRTGNPDIIVPLSETNNEFGEIANLTKRFFEQNQQLRNEMEERRKTEIMLRQAQKMESIGTLAGGIAHDFNNIITIISGYVALATGKLKDQPEVESNLGEAMLACMRAKKLIEKILTFSRQTEKNVQPVNLAAVVEETMELLKQTIPSSIRISADLRSNAFVLADPTEMQRVVMNITSNAYQAMRYQGGDIKISLREMSGNKVHKVVPETDPTLDYVALTIQDSGTGIPPENLARIFDPYFSTKASGEGTGLGLSIVQGIVKGNDGYIRISSIVNQGTSVTVFLPTTTLRLPEKTQVQPKFVFIPAHIFFVDDEPPLTALFTESLTEAGYTVTSFTDGNAALAHFQENSSACDLLVADIAMPELNGIQLAQKVRYISPNLPIVLYSGFMDNTIQKTCRELGINRLLVKPVLPDTLNHIIREILAEQKPILNLPI